MPKLSSAFCLLDTECICVDRADSSLILDDDERSPFLFIFSDRIRFLINLFCDNEYIHNCITKTTDHLLF